MTETKQDFTIREGDSVRITDTVTNVDDITGYSVQFVLARYVGAEPTVEYTDSDGAVTIENASNGELSVDLSPTDTDELAETNAEDYYYEIELTDTSGDVHTVTVGTITVEPSY